MSDTRVEDMTTTERALTPWREGVGRVTVDGRRRKAIRRIDGSVTYYLPKDASVTVGPFSTVGQTFTATPDA